MPQDSLKLCNPHTHEKLPNVFPYFMIPMVPSASVHAHAHTHTLTLIHSPRRVGEAGLYLPSE